MAKKKSASDDEKLKATVKQLRAELKQSERKRAAWKKRSKKAEAAVADLRTRLDEVEEGSRKARRKPAQARGPVDASVPGNRSAPAPTAVVPAGPDSTWTVAQLRAEARQRGLTGLSGKPKAELLAALT